MKKYFCLFLIVLVASAVKAQSTESDFGRLVLTPHINQSETLTQDIVSSLTKKLEQIISKSGAVAKSQNSNFVLSAELSIDSKDIISGPPQMIAQNIELTLRVGDAASGISFSMASVSLRGVGTNETKSTLEAIKNISTNNEEIQQCIEKGKLAIVAYYQKNCSKLIDAATSRAQMGNHDEAIYMLSMIPDACSVCYSTALETCQFVYQAKINAQSAQNLQAAKSAWSSEPTESGAIKAANFLQKINPYSNSFEEAQKLSTTIRKKFEDQQVAEWNFKLKQYEDTMSLKREEQLIAEENAKRTDISKEEQQKRMAELEKLRIVEYSSVAKEYAKNQLKKITYNNIIWK